MLKKTLKRHLRPIYNILSKLRLEMLRAIGKRDPIKLASYLYSNAHPGEKLDIEHPKNFSEKINWLKFHSDTSMWSRLADKYDVRRFIKENGLEHTLNEVYGVYDTAEEIDFESLPDKFVVKTTNGSSGNQVYLVKDKSKTDLEKVRRLAKKWLRTKNPFDLAEPHYQKIKPRVLVEKLLEPDDGGPITDYKLYCFDGKVHSVFISTDRDAFGISTAIYDTDWHKMSGCLKPEYSSDREFERPASLAEMIRYSEILSKGFPFVRIDWYEISKKPIFGEMTFTPDGGYNHRFTMEYLDQLGKIMDITTK